MLRVGIDGQFVSSWKVLLISGQTFSLARNWSSNFIRLDFLCDSNVSIFSYSRAMVILWPYNYRSLELWLWLA